MGGIMVMTFSSSFRFIMRVGHGLIIGAVMMAGFIVSAHAQTNNSMSYPRLQEGAYLTLFAGPSVSHSGVDKAIVGEERQEVAFVHGNDYGGFGGIAYGIMEKDLFFGIRPEIEFSLAQYQLRDARTGDIRTPNFESRSLRLMMNAYYDLPFNDFGYLHSLYVGTGIGFAFYDFAERRAGDSIRNHTDPEVLFGYQFMTGVTFAINERLGLNVGYRYFSTNNASIFYMTPETDLTETELKEFELHTHAIELGVRYGF